MQIELSATIVGFERTVISSCCDGNLIRISAPKLNFRDECPVPCFWIIKLSADLNVAVLV